MVEREGPEAENPRRRVVAAAVDALLAALHARDDYTGDHSEAVVELARAVAAALGLSGREATEVEQVAVLHDIGKLGIPDAVLHKPAPLDAEESAVMRRHPEIGERMIRSIPGLEHLAPAVRAEHERFDGGGYPDGLAGERIPLSSRIAFVCDAYHAMTSDRPYRRALGPARATAELRRNAGTQFCPRAAAALLGVLGDRSERPDATTAEAGGGARTVQHAA